MNKRTILALALTPALTLLGASKSVAAETFSVDYIELEECEYDQIAIEFSNGWVFICEDYYYPYHYGSATLIIDHYGYSGAKLCLSGGDCLKGRVE